MSSTSSENSDSDEERERNLKGKLFDTINQNNYTSLKQLFQKLEYEASSIVDAKDKNDNNNTLLQKAIKNRKRKINVDDNTRIIELLLHHGADPEATNDSGDSAYGLLEKRSKKYANDVDWIPVKNLLDSGKRGANSTVEPMDIEQLSFMTNTETYKASGLKTSLHGVIYQLQLLLLFLHRAIKLYDDVLLATELDVAEKFDDVVLRFKVDSKQSKYHWRFLQAKHLLDADKGAIKEGELFSLDDKKKFPLAKYFESFCKIKENPYFSGDDFEEFTICTNTMFHDSVKKYFEEDKRAKFDRILFFNRQGVTKFKLKDIAKDKIKDLCQLLMKAGSDSGKSKKEKKVKKKRPVKKNVNEKYLDEFLDKFRFIVNYPDRHRLNVLLRKELGEKMGLLDANLATSDFKNYILEWFMSYANKESQFLLIKDGKEFLKRICQRINTLMASGLSRAYPEKISSYRLKFQDIPQEVTRFFSSTDYQVLHLISDVTLFSSIKLNQYLDEKSGYFLKKDSVLFLSFNQMRRERIGHLILEAFGHEDSHNLLVLDCGTDQCSSSVLASKLLDILCNCGATKKLVIIGSDKNLIIKSLLDSNSGIRHLRTKDEFSFAGLIPSVQKSLMEKTIYFQGHQLFLKDILDTSSANKLMDPLTFETFIKTSRLRFDDPPAFERPITMETHYVKRTLSRQGVKPSVLLKKDFIGSHLLLVSNASSQDLAKCRVDAKKVHSWQDFKTKKIRNGILIVAQDEYADDIFAQLSNRKPEQNVYWLDYSQGKFYIECVAGCISPLKDFILTETSDKLTEADLQAKNAKTTIIAGNSGFGKSTFISHFVESLTSADKTLWVKRIDLQGYSPSKNLKEVAKTLEQENSAVDFLANLILKGSDDDLEVQLGRKLFAQSLLSDDGKYPKVILLFDAFDELSQKYKEISLVLLKALQATNVTKLLVTTKVHEKWNLEETLNTSAVFLKPFDRNQKLEYIEAFNRHRHQDNTDLYESMCYHLKNIKLSADEAAPKPMNVSREPFLENLTDEQRILERALNNEFSSNPLHLRMLIEELAVSKNTQMNKLSLPELYERFVTRKLDIFHEEKTTSNISLEADLNRRERDAETLRSIHEHLACQQLFPDLGMPVGLSCGDPAKLIVVGLVVKAQGEHIKFLHRSFAEYLVASYFAKNLHFPELQRILFSAIFANSEENKLIRLFLEENEHFVSNFRQNCNDCLCEKIKTEPKATAFLDMLSRENLRKTLKISMLLLAECQPKFVASLRSANHVPLYVAGILLIHSTEVFQLLCDSVFAFNFNTNFRRCKICHPIQVLFRCCEEEQITKYLNAIYKSDNNIGNFLIHTDEYYDTIIHTASKRGRFDHIQQFLLWVEEKAGKSFILPNKCPIIGSGCRDNGIIIAEFMQRSPSLSYNLLHVQLRYTKKTFLHVMNYHESFDSFLDFLFEHFEKPALEHLLTILDAEGISPINYFVRTFKHDNRALQSLLSRIVSNLDEQFIKANILNKNNFKCIQGFSENSEEVESDNKSYTFLLQFCLSHFDPVVIKESLLQVNGESLLHHTATHLTALRNLLTFLKSQYESNDIFHMLSQRDQFGRTPLHMAVKISLSSKCCEVMLEFAKSVLPPHCFTSLLLSQDSKGNSLFHSSCNYLANNNVLRYMLEYSRNNLSAMAFRNMLVLVNKERETFLFHPSLLRTALPKDSVLMHSLSMLSSVDLIALIAIVDQNSMTILHANMRLPSKGFDMEKILNLLTNCPLKQEVKNIIVKPDSTGKTALHFSIQDSLSDNFGILLSFCLTYFDPATLTEILLLRDQEDRTVLHHAFTHKHPSITSLITFVAFRPEMLLSYDHKLKTPLHVAILETQPWAVLNNVLNSAKVLDYTSLLTLLSSCDVDGNSILHYSAKLAEQNSGVLNFLREHLKEDDFIAVLSKQNVMCETFLYTIDKVHDFAILLEYLKDNELPHLLQSGSTLLHNFMNKNEEGYIKKLLRRLRKMWQAQDLQDFIIQVDDCQRTAMHNIVISTELWHYCFKYFKREEVQNLLCMKDCEGKLISHHHLLSSNLKNISYFLEHVKSVCGEDTLIRTLSELDLEGQTAVHLMLKNSQEDVALKVVQELLSPDCFFHLLTEITDGDECNLLHISCQANKVLNYIITFGKTNMDCSVFSNFVCSVDKQGRSVLHHAILANNLDGFKYIFKELEHTLLRKLLISHTHKNMTILHCVMAQASTGDIVALLIDAIEKLLNSNEISDLLMVINAERKSALHYYKDRIDGYLTVLQIALHVLIRSQFADLVCLADEDGRTILHYAAAHGGNALLTLLPWFKDNHEVFAKVILLLDNDLHTALHVAIMSKPTSEYFTILLNFTRDILGTEALSTMLLTRDSQGLSMLHYSCKYTRFCKIMMRECKLDLLNYAKKYLDDSSFQKLISLADVTGKNILHYSFCFTPQNCMDYVEACGNEQSKWDLLTAGDNEGRTLLHYMLAEDEIGECCNFLKKLIQVVDKNSVTQLFKIVDKNQRTPLHTETCGLLCGFQKGISLCQRLLDSSAFLSLLSTPDSMNQSIFIFSFLHLHWGFLQLYFEYLTQNYTLHMLQHLLNHVTNKRQNFLHMALQQEYSIEDMKTFLEFLAKVFPNFAEIAKLLVAKDVNGRSPITCPCFDTHLKTYEDDFAFFTKMTAKSGSITWPRDMQFETMLNCTLLRVLRINIYPDVLKDMFQNEEGQIVLEQVFKRFGENIEVLLKHLKFYIENNESCVINPETVFLKREKCNVIQLLNFCIFKLYERV